MFVFKQLACPLKSPVGLNQRGSKPTRHPSWWVQNPPGSLYELLGELTLSFIYFQDGPSCSTVSARPRGSCPALSSSLCGKVSYHCHRWQLCCLPLHISGRKEGWGSFSLRSSLSIREPFIAVRQLPPSFISQNQITCPSLDQPLAQGNGLHKSPLGLRTSPTFPRYMVA